MAAAIRSDRFILADIASNNNKFWNITLFDDHTVETSWGRVGEAGQHKQFPHAAPERATAFYESKCREKERKGYRPQRTLEPSGGEARPAPVNLAVVAQQQIAAGCPVTAALVRALAKENVHHILASTSLTYDTSRGTFSTPLGIVTADAIQEARSLLSEIGNFVAAGDYDGEALTRCLNDYLMIVPQDIGRRKPDPRLLYPDLAAVRRQNDLLDALDASLQQVLSGAEGEGPSAAAAPSRVFECSLTLVEDAHEIDRIRRKYHQTRQGMHGSSMLDVKRVFLVEIAPMRRAFEGDGLKLANVWELWHGTKKGNLLSILSKGFVIPPSNAPHCTGRLFGNGYYLSDQSTKSLNYCVSPKTRVLRKDLRWVAAAELHLGDELLAFDEERSDGWVRRGARRWRTSTVTNAGRAHLPSVEVALDNGDRLIVSRDHQFLFCHKASAVSWRRAEDLRPGNVIPRYLEPWEEDRSYDAGWLSGLFEGEGWSCVGNIGANQNPGLVYEDLVSRLEKRAHGTWTVARKNSGNSPSHSVYVTGALSDRLRFLGEVRPERLIRKHLLWLEGRIFQARSRPRVLEVNDVGIQELITLGTTTKTFLAEGYAGHNSMGYWDGKYDENCFMFLCNVGMGRYYVPRGAGESLPRRGHDSTFAMAGKSGVLNNEMIVYRCSQIDPVFLVEFSRGGQ